jgi:hypothetical protein
MSYNHLETPSSTEPWLIEMPLEDLVKDESNTLSSEF